MDIVSRLKKFINHESVAVTQFADNCKIPRPTLSQLLNGRNKKVSDELITKIHEAYPRLSVLWLMFGEGEMVTSQGQETNQPAAQQQLFSYPDQSQESQPDLTPRIDFGKNLMETESASAVESSELLPGMKSTPLDLADSSDTEQDNSTISFNPYAKKRIVNIIVYYDDNSFESFVPGQRK